MFMMHDSLLNFHSVFFLDTLYIYIYIIDTFNELLEISQTLSIFNLL
jgi:hypothetical protein